MNKKGFTLMELLAVIVVLAIVSMITIPIITDTVNDSKKEAFKDTALGILNTAKQTYLDYAGQTMRVNMSDYIIWLDGTETTTKMIYNGSSPKNGYVEIKADGSVTLIIYEGQYCAYKVSNLKNVDVKTIKSESECTFEELQKEG